MSDLTRLEALARAAAAETDVDEDWFCPDLIESREPILSAPAARRMIAALSPQTVLALLAVCKAAKRVSYSNGFDAALPEKKAELYAALKALEKP